MTDKTTGRRGETEPNELERPPTHLCPEHTGRQTQPSGCFACDQTRKRARLETRVRSLEDTIESYQSVLAQLQERIEELEDGA